MPRASSAPKAPRFPSAPTADDLEELMDDLGAIYDQAHAQADKLRAQKRQLDSQIRQADLDADRVREYVQAQLERLDLDDVAGARFRARLQANSRPSFAFEGDPSHIPAEFRKIIYKLDDAACLAAHAAGELPSCIDAALGTHVRIEAIP